MAKSSTGLEENVAGLLCYLVGWITGLIFFLIEKDSQFVKFHAMQSIITFGACVILGFIPVIGWIIWILALVMWILLMVKAYQGQKFKLPLIGDLAEKWSSA
ncbi:MAG: DUF4870 domain-containing protein [Dehalococcoidia bacterium]|jgi:uncharacterized membrane protein